MDASRALVEGDWISTLAGGWVVVEELYDTGLFEAVYNVRVAEDHTYFVGDETWAFGVWAHNACFGSLPGANQSLSRQGQIYALLAQQAFTDIPRLSRNATVAVSQAMIDGSEKYVFAVYGSQTAYEAIETFASHMGGVAFQASGGVHAEKYIYNNYGSNSGFTGVIGISNPGGCCSACVQYFASAGFANVWWPTDKAI